jgi:hypothetical protein
VNKGRFTVKLMKLKLQGLSLAWASAKALEGALAKCLNDHVFVKFEKVTYFNHNLFW